MIPAKINWFFTIQKNVIDFHFMNKISMISTPQKKKSSLAWSALHQEAGMVFIIRNHDCRDSKLHHQPFLVILVVFELFIQNV